jgi:hypothetical protein
MTSATDVGYHGTVPAPRSGARLWIAVGALLLGTAGRPCVAAAATTSYNVSGQAVVQFIGRTASVTIRTWNRDTVQIDTPDNAAFTATKGLQQTRASFAIPPVDVEEDRSPDPPTISTLLPEDFPAPKLVPGMHDVVKIVEVAQGPDAGRPGPPAAQLTVMIPQTAGLVNIRTGRGTVTLNDYSGTTIAIARGGRLVFNNVSGDAFVQPLNGRFYASDSTFDRLRVRSNRADLVFDSCRAKQIEATTLTGNIMYDNGVFDPGLARFESDRGSIALGVNGGAQFGAHTIDGRVLSELPPPPAAPALLGGDAVESLRVAGNGGPLVNATSNHGNVLLYDGSLADRRPAALAPAWHSMYSLLLTTRRNLTAPVRVPQPSGIQRRPPQRRPTANAFRRRWPKPPPPPPPPQRRQAANVFRRPWPKPPPPQRRQAANAVRRH